MKCIKLNGWNYINTGLLIENEELGKKFMQWYKKVNENHFTAFWVEISKVKTLWKYDNYENFKDAFNNSVLKYEVKVSGKDFFDAIREDEKDPGLIIEKKLRFNTKFRETLTSIFTKEELLDIFKISIIDIPKGCKYFAITNDSESEAEEIMFSKTEIYKEK